MFQGATALSLDAKGRLAIPARHRDALTPDGAPLVLTAHPHGCVLVYPEPAWLPIRDQVVAAPSLQKGSAALKRLLLGYAQTEALDGAGRVLVSPSLRLYANLDKQVWLVGQGTHFELWSDAGWQKQQDELLAILEEGMPAGFESLAL